MMVCGKGNWNGIKVVARYRGIIPLLQLFYPKNGKWTKSLANRGDGRHYKPISPLSFPIPIKLPSRLQIMFLFLRKLNCQTKKQIIHLSIIKHINQHKALKEKLSYTTYI